MSGRLLVLAALIVGSPALAAAQETARVTIPSAVSIAVTNVTVATSATAVRVSYDNALLLLGRRLRISVRADAANFTSPSPSAVLIPATQVRWTTANATNGTASSGTIASGAYTQMFQSNSGVTTGGYDVTWILNPPGGGIRSGAHTLVLRYRIESF